MKKIIFGLALLSALSALANDANFYKKAERAINENNASIINSNVMTIEKAQARAIKLLKKFENADKSSISEMQAVVNDANNLWPLLGEKEEGIREAVLAIKRKAMNNQDR